MGPELLMLTEKIKNNSIIWTSRNLEEVVRNISSSPLNGYSLKKKDELNEVVYWLSEGLVKCNIKKYKIDSDDSIIESKRILNNLTKEENNAYTEIENTSTYLNEIKMKYQIWKFLYKIGGRDFEFKKRNYAIYAKDLQIFVQTGDANITHIRDSFKKGITEYIILPYCSGNIGEMFIFQSTSKFNKFLQMQTDEEKEINEFFQRSKIKKQNRSIIDVPEKKRSYNLTDLVIFKAANKIHRGIVLGLIPPGKKGIRHAKEIFDNEERSHIEEVYKTQTHYEQMLNIKDDRVKFRWNIQEKAFKEEMVFVKRPKKTSTGVIMEYYAVTKEDILNLIPLDLKLIIERVRTIFERSNDKSLTIHFTREKSFTSNAAYDPAEHQIIVSVENLFHLVVNRFIDEGFSIYETTEMLIAHELGHADSNSLYLYNDMFYDVINRFNDTNHWIQNHWQDIIFCSAPKDIAETTLKKLQELLFLAETYKKLELQGEKDAFKHGLNYISKDLHFVFEQENYSTFTSYKIRHEKQINLIREQFNHLKEILLDYEQLL